MARRRRRKSDEAPGWVWMLFGLGIGLIIAFGVYINSRPDAQGNGPGRAATDVTTTPAEQPRQEQPRVEQPRNEQQAIEPQPVANDPQPEAAAETNARPPAQPDEDPNRFGFYDFLASFEVVIADVDAPLPQSQPVVAIEDPGIYLLQAGSFLTEADAEAQRARLALLGVESRIQRVPIDDRTFNRVLVGPLEDLDELNSIRARLTQASVDSLVMKMSR